MNSRILRGEQPRTNSVRPTGRIKALRPGEKRHSEMTPVEKWLYKRSRFMELLPTRLGPLDERFQLLIKLANRESYEFSDKEGELIVARLLGWVDAVEKSFKSRKPVQPIDLPQVALDSDMAPPVDDQTLPPLRDFGRHLVSYA